MSIDFPGKDALISDDLEERGANGAAARRYGTASEDIQGGERASYKLAVPE